MDITRIHRVASWIPELAEKVVKEHYESTLTC